MPSAVIDVSTRNLIVALLVVTLGGLAMFGTPLHLFSTPQPEVLEGEFVKDGGSGLFAVADTTCSTDGDCPSTTCDGDTYLVDTDGSVSCTDYDGDGDTECVGYDKTYSDAEYCGGRYDYNCDSSGCDGYKAACEDDCSANSGCDTYSFCGSDDDDSGGSSGSDTSSCSDLCESLTKKCSDGNIVQCQDTDTDSCTDGFVTIESCTDGCSNAACIAADTGDETADETEDVVDEVDPAPDDPDTQQTLGERLHEVWQRIVVALFGGL